LLSPTPLGVEGALQAFCQITERSRCFAQVRILFLEVADTRETVFKGPRVRFAQRALLSRMGLKDDRRFRAGMLRTILCFFVDNVVPFAS
jgi:hypothetical protein